MNEEYKKIVLSQQLFIDDYQHKQYKTQPKLVNFDYYTGIPTTCFNLSITGIVSCWSRAIAARVLGRPTSILNTNRNGKNYISGSDGSIWVIYDTEDPRLATMIESSPNSLFLSVYNSLPEKVKIKLTRAGYTITDRGRLILHGDVSGAEIL